MKRFILPLAFGLFAAPVFADNVNIYVPRDGGGVTQKPGNASVQEAAILMGQDAPPKGATGIIIERGKPARWTDLPPGDVNKAFGGDGDPEVELLPSDDPDSPIPVFTGDEDPTEPLPLPKNEKEPIEIFPEDDDNAGRIVLNTGNWVGIVRSQTLDGCTGAIAEAVAAQTAALNGTSLDGKIDANFNPNIAAPALDWEKTGANSWLADFEPGGGTGIRMQWLMSVKSPDLIENTQQLNIITCKAVTRVDYVRQ